MANISTSKILGIKAFKNSVKMLPPLCWKSYWWGDKLEYMYQPISSKTLRAERRAKKIKRGVEIIEDSLLYGFFALIAIGMLWIIQVGVTSI